MDVLSTALTLVSPASSLVSFLGGSAFRMIWGEASAYFTRKQEHAQEVERMKVQADLADKEHARNLEAMRVQNELGIKVIEVQSQAALDQIETDAWATLVTNTTQKTGYGFIDIWKMSIQPALATFALLVVAGEVIRSGFVLSVWIMDLVSSILGIYLADRHLSRRGK
jgi:hypothetical protein